MKDHKNEHHTNLDDWKPIDTFVQEHPQFTINQVRWLLRNRTNNQIKKVTRKIGRRIYLNERLFSDWMLSNET